MVTTLSRKLWVSKDKTGFQSYMDLVQVPVLSLINYVIMGELLKFSKSGTLEQSGFLVASNRKSHWNGFAWCFLLIPNMRLFSIQTTDSPIL